MHKNIFLLFSISFCLIFIGPAPDLWAASTVNIGVTSVLTAADNGNGNLLIAQKATLSQAATIESLSFYVTKANGNLRMGIYDATGPKGGPGALKAQTNSITPVKGWNTANVMTPVALPAGSYWLAYLPSSNGLAFVKENNSGPCEYHTYKYGTMPGTFSASPKSCTPTNWSFYATLNLQAVSPINGVCGSANGTAVSNAPSTNLCGTGSATSVSGVSGPWSWSCDGSNGGSNATCSAPVLAPASCGSTPSGSTVTQTVSTTPGSITATTAQCPYGGTQPTTTTVTQTYLCTNGSLSAQGSPFSTTIDNGSPACNPAPAPVNGTCGSANGVEITSAPTANLCNTGSASPVTENGTTTWNWDCNGSNGGSNASCLAPVQPAAVNGACGSANGTGVTSAPSAKLCGSGAATTVSGTGPWTWQCDGTRGALMYLVPRLCWSMETAAAPMGRRSV